MNLNIDVFGIPTHLSASFATTVTLVTILIYGYLRRTSKVAERRYCGFATAVIISVSLLCLMAHEMGHILTIYSLGREILKMTVSLAGPSVAFSLDIPIFERILILVMGPIIQFALALTFSRIARQYRSSLTKRSICCIAVINYIGTIVNIAPLPGSDGQGIVYLLLCSTVGVKMAMGWLQLISLPICLSLWYSRNRLKKSIVATWSA